MNTLYEAGHAVTRWHTIPTPHRQNLADHSWGVAMIISQYYPSDVPEDKLALMEAALDHDLAESKIGDMPRYSKTPEHEVLEEAVAIQMGLKSALLRMDLAIWLSWADLAEAGLYARHQIRLGNTYFVDVIGNIRNTFLDRGQCCPVPMVHLFEGILA